MPEICFAQAPRALPCPLCRDEPACLMDGANGSWLSDLKSRTQTHRYVHRGQHLFRADEASKGLFLVQSGCFKVYGLDPLGREYIAGFRLPAGLLGLHSLCNGRHQFNAVALTDSGVCVLALEALRSLTVRTPALLTNLLKIISQEILDGAFLTGALSAEERLVSFLVHFAAKLRAQETDGVLYLYMPRGDIATYLRLAPATVSRILTRLKDQGIIDSDYHHIKILDQTRLRELERNTHFLPG